MANHPESVVDRVRNLGVRGAAVVDLIAVGFSRREQDAHLAESMGRTMLAKYPGIQALGEASGVELSDLTGLDGFEVLRCQALLELGRRIGSAGKGPVQSISDPSDVYRALEHLSREKREHFVAVLLDSKNGILRKHEVHIGTVNMSIVGPREVFREAIRDGAASLIVAHNHPSGDPSPSPEDVEVTVRLAEVGRLLDIPLLDHVIIGDRRWTSLKEKGVI